MSRKREESGEASIEVGFLISASLQWLQEWRTCLERGLGLNRTAHLNAVDLNFFG